MRAGDLNEGVVVDAKIWGLDGGWSAMANDDGIVYGNVTAAAN